MLILPGLLWGLLSFIAIGLDICIFFLLIRFILIWRKASWFEWFNDVGKNLVDAITAKTRQLWYQASQKQLSDRGELLVALTVISFVRFLLCEIATLL